MEGCADGTRRTTARRRSASGGLVGWRTCAALLALVWGCAFAFQPVLGTEFLISDASGSTLVGYGRLGEAGLEIRLARAADQVRVVVVGPDGTARTYSGLLRDGRLEIVTEDGTILDVADTLAQNEQSLSLAWPDESARVVPPRGTEEAGSGAATSAEDDGAATSSAPAASPGEPEEDGNAGRGRGRPDSPGGGRPGGDEGPGRGPPEGGPPGLDRRPDVPGGRNLLGDPESSLLAPDGVPEASIDTSDGPLDGGGLDAGGALP